MNKLVLQQLLMVYTNISCSELAFLRLEAEHLAVAHTHTNTIDIIVLKDIVIPWGFAQGRVFTNPVTGSTAVSNPFN